MMAPRDDSRIPTALLTFALLIPIGLGLLRDGRDLVNAEPYEARRNTVAFSGLDMRMVPELADQVLAPTTSMSLGPSFFVDRAHGADFWYRATYAFYPRRIEASSSHALEIRSSGDSSDGVVLGRIDDRRSLVLLGSPDPSPGSAGNKDTAVDPWGIGIALAGILGLGMLVRFPFRLPPCSAMEVALWGVFGLAVAAHLATWFQVSLPWRWVSALGLAFAAFAAVRGRGRARTRTFRAAVRGWSQRSAWGILPLLVVSLSLARAFLIPPSDWDGRFIWLLHGAQLFFSGFLDVSESANLARLQPTYPLLTPALFSFGSAWRDAFNERTAVLLGVIFHAAVIGAVARIAMASMGALRGALFASLCAGLSMGRSTEAYADGLLASTLALEFLALERAGTSRLGWLALACAALTKREGLPLALIVALVQRGFCEWRSAAFWLSPALAHVLWSRFVGLAHEMDSPRLPLDLADMVSRSVLIVRKAAGVVARSTLNSLAAIGLVALASRRVGGSRTAASAFLVALCYLGFVFVTFLLTPQPLAWHLDTALGRLALHPAVFVFLSGFAWWDASSRSEHASPRRPF